MILYDIVACVLLHVALQHLLHLVSPVTAGGRADVHVVLVEVPPIEELFQGAPGQAGEPADLTEVTHVPQGGGVGGRGQEDQQQHCQQRDGHPTIQG